MPYACRGITKQRSPSWFARGWATALTGFANGAQYFCQRTSFVSIATKSTKAKKKPQTARSGFSARLASGGTTRTVKKLTD